MISSITVFAVLEDIKNNFAFCKHGIIIAYFIGAFFACSINSLKLNLADSCS